MSRTFRLFTACPLFLALLSPTLFAQEDETSYRAALRISDPAEKVLALEKFLKTFPESNLKARAYNALFNFHLDLGAVASALEAGTGYIQELPGGERMMAYNNLAYTLAQRNVGLDTALAYALRAEAEARALQSPRLGMILDTHAFVAYQLGDAATAEKLQRQAIVGHEKDPGYIKYLAIYEEAVGKRIEALRTISRAILLGDTGESLTRFLEWIQKVGTSEAERNTLKSQIVTDVVESHLAELPTETRISARSNAAVFMARTGVEVARAEQWATEAVSSLARGGQVTDLIEHNTNLATVLAARGKEAEALRILDSFEHLASPWDAAFWMLKGEIHEQRHDLNEAIISYAIVSLGRRDERIIQALERAYSREHGSTEGLDEYRNRLRGSLEEPQFGHRPSSAPWTGKVVLAELFTGAECAPCVGADLAFDGLSEYYPRKNLAILEYHVHIPGADPLTTPETYDRYDFYGGNPGTPTVLIDGRDRIIGGGPKFTVSNRFQVYKHAIERYAPGKPDVLLSATAKAEADIVVVHVKIDQQRNLPPSKKHALHIALVERSVDYVGGNGISKHAFVVRKLTEGASGFELTAAKKTSAVKRTIDLTQVEKMIAGYLDNPTVDRSWPSWLRNFSGWKSRPEKLKRDDLAVVAWVQDMETKEVLQAVYTDVPPSIVRK